MKSESRAFALAVLIGFAVAFGVGVVNVFAQTIDPRIGSWKLNVAKSQFSPGPPPQSNTLVIEASGKGEKVTTEGVSAQGRRAATQYTATFDGKDYPLTGSQIADTVSLRRINARITVRTDKKDGKVIQTLTRIVSEDGKTMIVRANGMNAQGQPVESVGAWEKQ
jgi:hypothetical protein